MRAHRRGRPDGGAKGGGGGGAGGATGGTEGARRRARRRAGAGGGAFVAAQRAHAVAVVPAGETVDRAAGFVARGGRHWSTQRGAARRRRRSRIHAVVLYFAAVATVVIAANPYEAELCRKALGETGLQVQVAEGGDGLLDLIVSARPL